MPRGDGTGPAGLGPMTGRAAGFCAGYPVPGYMNPIPGGRRGFGRGWGRGFGRGWGRGRGGYGYYGYPAGYDYPAGAYPYGPEMTPKQEIDMLRQEADALKAELKEVQKCIDSLEKGNKKTAGKEG